jgi:hypothetical protein
VTRKFSFLPAFFLVLAVVFGIAVFLRVRAYQTADELPQGLTRPAETATHSAGVTSAPPDPGQIVEIAPDGTTIAPTGTSARDRSAAASAREQRYNELLRTAPPAVPPETMFQKIVNPIANALGITEKKPVAAAAPRPAAPPRPTSQQLQQQQQRQQQQQQQEAAKKAEETEQPPTDEDSDTKPPQLIGIEFTPSQVKDGGETALVLTVVDDLSGVRSVSGVIASPAGALQGFAGQREPETNRYVSRIQIPAEAAEGTWKINYVSLSDNAGNSIQLTAAQGNLPQTAAFQVRSSQSDSKGPTLRNVWVDKPAISAGEKTTIFVDAEDDKSGVTLASGVFVSPGKHARLGFGCRPGAEGSTTWECDFTPAANVECGLWQLEQIQLQDKARNMATFRTDMPAVKAVQLDISGQGCDSTPPVLSSLALNPMRVSNADASSINVIAMVTDDLSGVAHINAQAYGPTGPSGARLSFSLASPDGGQTWTGVINVPKNAANGTWSVGWVQVIDKAQNLRAYSANDPVLAGVKFEVE